MEDARVLQLSGNRFSDFYLNFCGKAQCSPSHSFGPAVRPNYILHYITKGQGVFQVGGATYSLRAGQGFLIEPDVSTYYRADSLEPWEYIWIGFSGSSARDRLDDIGLGNNRHIFHSKRGSELDSIVEQMFSFQGNSLDQEYCLQGLLYRFFSEICKDAQEGSPTSRRPGSAHVERAVQFIHNNYAEGIRVADIAKHVAIDRSYLYTLFQNELSISPAQYLADFRLTRAAELLKLTDLPIDAVAYSCGYRDRLVFSKAFKSRNGLAPYAYREQEYAKTMHGGPGQ